MGGRLGSSDDRVVRHAPHVKAWVWKVLVLWVTSEVEVPEACCSSFFGVMEVLTCPYTNIIVPHAAGAKDITVKSKDGRTFRSISQAAYALAGGAHPPTANGTAGGGADGKRQRKKRRLTLSASPAKPAKGGRCSTITPWAWEGYRRLGENSAVDAAYSLIFALVW